MKKRNILAKKKTKKSIKHGLRVVGQLLLVFLLTLLLPVFVYQIIFFHKIHPGIFVAGIDIGGYSKDEAINLLSQKVFMPDSLVLVNQNQTFVFYTKDVNASYDIASSVGKAFALTRSGNFFVDIYKRFDLLINKSNFPLLIIFDENALSKYISVISGQDSVETIPPTVKLAAGNILVSKGSPGKEIDQEELRKTIETNLSFANYGNINIPVNFYNPSISELEALVIKARAEKYIGKKVSFKFEYSTFTLTDSDLINLLNPKAGFDDDKINRTIDKISSQIERPPQNPKFTFDAGKVTQFQPALDGIKTNKDDFKNQLTNSLTGIEEGLNENSTFEIPVTRISPEITMDKVNNLGIKELIGRGTSTYYHSIPSRVHNVALAAGKINGTLVKPGDTFSFNQALGDVSQFTGYEQAYIISQGKTILGDGGGVCQVSTTLFRALLKAGLPITERTAHAYRVGYYEQGSPPGLDATVYGPAPDLKFVNDTPGYILIEALADTKRYSLIFQLYGTSDGRVAAVSKPVVRDVTAPPADLYQDDPNLPAGTVKQIDFKAWGAKVTFNYKVTRNGETLINKTFTSNYRPWQAVYLRGTGP